MSSPRCITIRPLRNFKIIAIGSCRLSPVERDLDLGLEPFLLNVVVCCVWLITGLSPLCVRQVLGQVVNMKVQVFMNCRAKLSEMPLKR